MNHLRSDPVVFTTVVAMSGAVRRGSVREFASENQSRGFALQHLSSLQYGGKRLEGTGRVGRVDIVITVVLRVSGYITRTARLSGHVA